MKKTLSLIVISILLFSCKNEVSKGKFTVSGNIKNVPDQQVYLDQLFFSQKNPEILDTAQIKDGKFELTTIAAEEGLYRIRFEKQESGFVFINDKPQVTINADIKDESLEGPVINTPANMKLKDLLIHVAAASKKVQGFSVTLDSLRKNAASDSLVGVETLKLKDAGDAFTSYITKFIDTTSDPVVAMFALGYTQNIDPAKLKDIVPNMEKRFPKHQGVASLIIQYNQMMAQYSMQHSNPQVGSMAPDFTLNDASGKPVTLSSFKGKYVLVDFWASWCGPCRNESPFLVAAYEKFKNKNFTILGVSLDDDKADWQDAVKEDKLVWQQVSDLKGMDSPVGTLYGINAIPYNALIDPDGKIIATELRGSDLDRKLSEVLK